MDLAAAERRLDEGEGQAARELIEQAKKVNAQALVDLRALARGIAPPTLAERGLLAAMTIAAASSPVKVRLGGNVRESDRFSQGQETALYFTFCELVANAAKHSESDGIDAQLQRADDRLELTVRDWGRGGAQMLPGHGLAGLADRLAGLDGKLELTTTVGGNGTTAKASVPI
jgi:signal transduction histidine kinase